MIGMFEFDDQLLVELLISKVILGMTEFFSSLCCVFFLRLLAWSVSWFHGSAWHQCFGPLHWLEHL